MNIKPMIEFLARVAAKQCLADIEAREHVSTQWNGGERRQVWSGHIDHLASGRARISARVLTSIPATDSIRPSRGVKETGPKPGLKTGLKPSPKIGPKPGPKLGPKPGPKRAVATAV